MDRAAQLIDEITQLTIQYKNEVPGGRRAWPKSIKERVFELVDSGAKRGEICERTGIAYHTIHGWLDQRKASLPATFEQVAVVAEVPTKRKRRGPRKSSTVTVKNEVVTVTVKTPNGYVIEGLPVKDVMDWLGWPS